MFHALTDNDFPAAAALLTEGFPERGPHFWQQGLHRLRQHAGNAAAGVPLGLLMKDGERPVGVALTPASQRHRTDGSVQTLVNVSSWYVQPTYRWRAGLMLRALVSDASRSYIDLTPTEDVARMLPVFGFRPVNRGTTVALLPMLALGRSGGARIHPLQPGDRLPDGSPPMEQLLAHRELNCWPLLLEHGTGSTLLVYRPRPLRGVPGARLKYIGSHTMLRQHLPVVARHLLARGLPLLTWDTREDDATSRAFIHRPGGIWYAKGTAFEDYTDFVGTELCILGV